MKNINLLDSHLCTGCGACMNICPTGAISMQTNSEGFAYPRVIADKCTDCGICASICPQLNEINYQLDSPLCYAVICKNKFRDNTSSGGVFCALADAFLKKGGIVFGAAFNDDFTEVKHIAVEDKKSLHRILKSKYVQSDTLDSFKQAKKYLDSGKKVLFAGCPCQIEGLKKFLRKDYDNLLTVDILCHGVPSPAAYKSFLKEVSKGRTVKSVDFRDKKYGWGTLISVEFENETHYDYYDGMYFKSFLSGLSMRESCFSCKYARPERVGDLTLGDFWGIKTYLEKLDDKKGTSFVLCNNRKGKAAMDKLHSDISVIREIPFHVAVDIGKKANGALVRPTSMPTMRKCFFNHLKKGEPFSVAYRYAATSLLDVGILGWWIETPRSNYGSTLTNFALYKYLLSQGLSVAMISPPNFDRNYAGEFNKRHAYRMTAKYSAENMGENNKYIDKFIVASDVLWYYDAFIKTGYFFMLDFVNDDKKKISYATSFGNTNRFFPPEEILKARSLLKRFDAVSVREYEGVDICRDKFDVQATQVLDPVFICDTKEWDYLASLAERKTEGKFLFAYILDPNEEKAKRLARIADSKSLDLVTITDKQFNAEDKADILKKYGLLQSASIEELIYHIKNASFVVTDSYHGMCFSLILRKSFLTLINRSRGAARFETLAQDFDIADRMVENLDEAIRNPSFLADVNYQKIEPKIESEILRSKKWLEDALNGDKKPHIKSDFDLLVDELLTLKQKVTELENKLNH